MRTSQAFVTGFLSVALLILAGCGAGDKASTDQLTPPTGNWEVRSYSAAQSNLIFRGAVTQNGTATQGAPAPVSAVFRLADASALPLCPALAQAVTYTGTLDVKGNINLSATAGGAVVSFQFTPGVASAGTYDGSLQITGTSCSLTAANMYANHLQSITGVSAGTFAGATSMGTSTNGSLSLNLTQAATAAANGAYTATGTLTYTSASCSVTGPVTGTANGTALVLTTALASGSANFTGSIAVLDTRLSGTLTLVNAGTCGTITLVGLTTR